MSKCLFKVGTFMRTGDYQIVDCLEMIYNGVHNLF